MLFRSNLGYYSTVILLLSIEILFYYTVITLLLHCEKYSPESQATGANGRGIRRLNLFLLKPSRFKVLASGGLAGQLLCVSRGNERWVTYEPRILEPLLQFLPTILARWIVENLFDELNLEGPPRPWATDTVNEDHAGRKWTTMSLNYVLQRAVEQAADGTHLAVFGGIEHESELFEGTSRIRCHNSFHGKTRRVSSLFYYSVITLLLHLYYTVPDPRSDLFQDCFATIPPHPFYLGDRSEFHIMKDMEDVMYGRPILFFSVVFRPLNSPPDDRFKCNLVFFSAFETLDLPSESEHPTQREECRLLYEPGQIGRAHV